MYSERNRSGWAALSSISVVLAAPVAAQTPDAATIATAAVQAARVRATAFPPIQSLDGLAEKFNLHNATSLGAFIDACPLGLSPPTPQRIRSDAFHL
jgi:hypothetical protein